MDEKIRLIAKSYGEEKVKFDEKLSYHLASKTGGVAKLFAVAMNERELIKIVEACQQLQVPFMVIGTGSKVGIPQEGFDGVVIRTRTQNIKIVSIKGKVGRKGLGVDYVLIEVDSGTSIPKFIEYLDKQGLVSEEFNNLTGSIGGNIFTNRSLQERSESVKVLNLDTDTEIIPVSELNMRTHVVISVVLRIKARG